METTLYYHDSGDLGLNPIGQSEERTIVNAIKRYVESNGETPASHTVLLQYPSIQKLDPDILEGMFKAITTKPGGT